MTNEDQRPTLGQRVATKATDIAVSEAKSAAFWWSASKLGALLMAALTAWATIPAGTINMGVKPNVMAHNASYSCVGKSGKTRHTSNYSAAWADKCQSAPIQQGY